jgi:two-component system LytT family response regulator
VALTREERERTGAKLRAAELELQVLKRRLRQLVVHTRGVREIVDLGEVLVIRGADDYAELVLAGGATKLLGETLASLAERLPDDFLRVHRSAIVNLTFVTEVARKSGGGLEVTLSDGSTVGVGRSYARALKAAIGG